MGAQAGIEIAMTAVDLEPWTSCCCADADCTRSGTAGGDIVETLELEMGIHEKGHAPDYARQSAWRARTISMVILTEVCQVESTS